MSVQPPLKFKRFIQIDEEGYFKMDDLRVADADAGREWLARLTVDRGRAITSMNDEPILVEAFDEPYVALQVEAPHEASSDSNWIATMPYGYHEEFQLDTLSLDEWDRFHGRTARGVPFVFSRAAQNEFFNLLDEFDDDSITFRGERIETTPWLPDNPDVNTQDWWTNLYRTNESRWELNAPSHVLDKIAPRLKLQRMRVLVPGAGSGNDAAWFAEQGHIVTALDFSDEAIARAKAKYGHYSNLTFVKADVFALPSTMNSSYDLVFEHTCYCAITPSRRNELVKIWRRVLTEHGHMMGVFFTFDKRIGPPYGGSEWEIRSRIEKSFRPLYWMRLRDSIEARLGHELFVYAQKLPSI